MADKDTTPTLAISDFNLLTISTEEYSETLKGALEAGANFAIFGRRGSGKMLDLETDLPTPKGFVKLKDLKEGDQLFDEQGAICNVTKLHPIDTSPVSYKVSFDDGSQVNACADHLWLTWDKSARKSHQECDVPGKFPQVRSTLEILNTLKTLTSKPETNHSIKNSLPVQFSEKELVINPYVLGIWLGDGRTNTGSIETADDKVLEEIIIAGYSVNKNSNNKKFSKSNSCRIGDKVYYKGQNKIGELKKHLIYYNLLGNKHIPDIYMLGSYSQRLALLQGLMDSDGTCGKDGEVEFCSTLPNLAEQTFILMNSLGIKAKIHKNESWLYDVQHKDRYRVIAITKLPIFRLDRKLINLKKTTAQDCRNNHRYIINVEPISPVPMRCITVDSPSHLYLITKSFIPTHNTEIAKQTVASTDLSDNGSGLKALEVYINLSVVERPDMGGYPDMFSVMAGAKSDEEKRARFVSYILPKFYEAMIVGERPVVAIFDEGDKADPSVIAPLLEIFQYRSINGNKLPNLRSSIMTGNLISEGSARPSLPLLDRTEKYLLQADTTSFLKWAAKSNKIHPSVRAFLQDKTAYLYGSNDGGADLYAEASPRGWEYSSNAIFFGEKKGWSKDLINRKVSGYVGRQAGMEYQIYFQHYKELLPLIDSIFNGEDVVAEYKKLDSSKQLYAAMIASSRLAGILDRVPLDEDGIPTHKPKELAYVGAFMNRGVSDENVLVSVRTQLMVDRLVTWDLDSNKDWGKILVNVTNTVDRG